MNSTFQKQTIIFLLSFFLAFASFGWAQNSSPPDSMKQNHNSLVALPYAYYTPETKIAIGVGGIYSFRAADISPEDRPSSVRLALTYTQKKQIILGFQPEIYLKNEKYFFSGFYAYYKYPDKFWAIGAETPDAAEEDYEPNYFKSYTNFQKRITSGLYIGLRYQFENISLTKTDEDGVLQYHSIPGSEAGSASGFGFIINYDTRSHIYYPSAGFYNQIYAAFFRKAFGSDYKFNMITFQAEYRLPLFWRLGAVGFAGFGDVARKIEDFEISRFKYTVGIAFRFMFDSQERINARLDIGFGKNGNSGIYALVVEAF